MSDCILCQAGSYAGGSGSSSPSDCIPCVAGRYGVVAGSVLETDCIECAAGKWGSGVGSFAASDCIECVAGKYVDGTGSSTSSDCIDCPAGQYINTAGSGAASDCIDCVPGKFIDVTGSDESLDCIECAAGQYSDVSGSAGCIGCAPGKYINVTGTNHALACIDCVPGMFVELSGSDESTDCISCVAGRYTEVSGSDFSCNECTPGQYSAAGSAFCVACSLNSGTRGLWGAPNCTCNIGFQTIGTACTRCFATVGSTCMTALPSVMIFNVSHSDKVNPSLPLVLQSNVTTYDVSTSPRLRWSVWRASTIGFIEAFDLASTHVLDSAADGENLVIRAGVLTAGSTYKVRLAAAVGQVVAHAEIDFTLNIPPIPGSLMLSPTVGITLNSTFTISAEGFVDIDLPLTYRFGHRRWHQFTTIAPRSVAKVVQVLLPAGHEGNNYTYSVVVSVYDVYSASTEDTNTVSVTPYEKLASESWSNTVRRAMESAGGLAEMAELSGCVASVLNSANTTVANATDLELSRRMLVQDLTAAVVGASSTGTVLTAEDAGMVLSALEQVTDAHGQLSADLVETSASLLRVLTKGSEENSQPISFEAVGSVARVSSNLLGASTPNANQVSTRHQAAVDTVTAVLAAVSQSIAQSLVSNQNPFQVETPSFTLQVARVSTASHAAANRSLPAIAQLPAAELPTDVGIQTVSWNENPFTGNTADGQPKMLVSTSVLTVNMFSQGKTLNVSDLDAKIHLELPVGLPQNLTEESNRCEATACLNRYDIGQRDGRACLHLIDSSAYSCTQHFCPSCVYAGFCDQSCGFGLCVGTVIQGINVSNRSWCRLPAVPTCSYLDTRDNSWKLDGELVASSRTQATCAFDHLTDFAVLFGPPPELNALAPPSKTLNLVQFFRDNPAGLVIAAVSLAMLCVTCCHGASKDRSVLLTEGRGITHAMMIQSVYAQRMRTLYNSSWRVMEGLATRLRTQWTCGSLWLPIEGDPMSRMHRHLVLLATINASLAVNGLFFRLDDTLEVCDTTAELGTTCTAELRDADLCICKLCKCTIILQPFALILRVLLSRHV